MDYFYQEEQIISQKKTIGVLCRGTDYVTMKPKNHPIQPTPEELIGIIKDKQYDFDYIYLATEEKRIFSQFDKAFPGKILINKRQWFDDYYTIQERNKFTFIDAVNFERENDNFQRSLEYLSSINILSKCSALVGGTCGGSRLALYWNNGKYEYSNLLNLGKY